ncbi:MAG: DUF4835 family protein [Bacteroidales bacterium]|nr:DUF4835 family protein [Bacteroidales bacterium]
MRKLIISVFFLIISFVASAQEFNCVVKVISPQVQETDKHIYESLQNVIFDFVNNRKWSNHVYEMEERIECTLMLNIKNRDMNTFSGELNVILRRPIFNTSYNSILFNYVDKDIQFEYVENQPLDYADNTFSSNLTSVLAYYSYVLLGLDGDSYSSLGGTDYYQKAKAVVDAAQNAKEPGWQAFQSQKNRFWLIENLMNNNYYPIRNCIYEYHRKGLDTMYDRLESGRSVIAGSLMPLKKVYNDRPNLFLLRVFFDAKSDELVEIFSQATSSEKNKVVSLLKEIDPANASKYQKILKK